MILLKTDFQIKNAVSQVAAVFDLMSLDASPAATPPQPAPRSRLTSGAGLQPDCPSGQVQSCKSLSQLKQITSSRIISP